MVNTTLGLLGRVGKKEPFAMQANFYTRAPLTLRAACGARTACMANQYSGQPTFSKVPSPAETGSVAKEVVSTDMKRKLFGIPE
jgi:hypothetical protein